VPLNLRELSLFICSPVAMYLLLIDRNRKFVALDWIYLDKFILHLPNLWITVQIVHFAAERPVGE